MANFCGNCGAQVISSWNVCPYCGTTLEIAPQQEEQFSVPSKSYSVPTYTPTTPKVTPSGGTIIYGVIAVVFGIIGLIVFGLIFGIIAIILGAIGVNKDENTSAASIGLILGILDIVFYFVVIIILFG